MGLLGIDESLEKFRAQISPTVLYSMTESKRYDTSVEEIEDEEELKDIDPKWKS